jgi:AcrR family transcriptional regulator
VQLERPRTDALRNRERILEVAKEAFTRFGADASLDDIAKQAGVGAGTLYRHFPTRDALIEAVYRSEVEKLAAAERKFAETMPPIEALRAWMLLVRGPHCRKADHCPRAEQCRRRRHKAL